MNQITLSTMLTLTALTPFAMQGQDMPSQDLPDNPNRFSFGPTFGLNFKAEFHNSGVNPGPALGDANHNYNDGYVRVDNSGDAGGLTSFWGYKNASQAVGNTIQFHALQGGGPSSVTADPQYGGELKYQRVIGTLSFLSGDWGLETSVGVTKLDLRENNSGAGEVTVDSYQLNGVLAPAPGYQGTASGPGALLGDTPTRTTTSEALTGYQKITGEMFTLRLGPFADWKITHKFSLAASVGLTLAPTRADYDFSETAALGGGGTIVENGHSSKTQLLYGPYAGAQLQYDFTKHWGVYAGARFQNLTTLDQSVDGRTARLDPSITAFATAGLNWSF